MPSDRKPEGDLRKFQGDVTLVLVGLFLALAVQYLIQFIQSFLPKISPYFYLSISIISIVIVLVLLNRAAGFAGIKGQFRTNPVPGDPSDDS